MDNEQARRLIADIFTECGFEYVQPWDVYIHEDDIVVHLFDASNLLVMQDLLARLRAAGARSVELGTWESGTSEDLVSGPQITIRL